MRAYHELYYKEVVVIKICIDPGHGGADSGAIGNRSYEKDNVLLISKYLTEYLNINGFDVINTRTTDSFVFIRERIEICNLNNCDIFISLHNNESILDTRGTETVYFSDSVEGEDLAEIIQQNILYAMANKHHDRGVIPSDDMLLRDTKAVSILINIGFITNSEDEEHLRNSPSCKRIAQKIASGICEYANIEFSEYLSMRTGEVTAKVNVRSRDNKDADSLGSLDKGEKVTVVQKSGEWYKLQIREGLYGYSNSNHIKLIY